MQQLTKTLLLSFILIQTTTAPIKALDFLKVKGTNIINTATKQRVSLRGIALFNNSTDTLSHNRHRIPQWFLTEKDFEVLARSFSNVARYGLNYRWFEQESNPYQYKNIGFADLDLRLNWAKKHGIYIILDMHNAQGGLQEQGKGNQLWENIENRQRLVNLWKKIAKRYRDNPTIAG